jgi:hypothetical protein
MGLSVDDIVAKFPTKTLPTTEGEPNYSSISTMVQTLYGNAASLSTTLGGGQHGHVGLVMTPILYATLSNTAYNNPIDPGPTPNHPVGASQAARETQRLNHTEERRIFDNHQNMDDALKALIVDTVDETYLNELRNKYTGYLGVSTRDLVDHLLDRYGKITPADIAECKSRMNDPIDPTQPIDQYFRKIDDCVQYAADGQVAFTPDQILQTSYHAVSTSGHYNDACKEWRRKAAIDKTWHNFKRFFAAEYHDLKEQQKVNTSQSNFHGANAAYDISMALDNLALAATSDRDIVMQLTTSNQQLTTINQTLTAELQKALATNAILVKKIGNSTPPETPSTRPPKERNERNTRFNHAEWKASLDPHGYCWSHGYNVTHGHDSKSCKGKLFGHQLTATRQDNKGGSQRGKE